MPQYWNLETADQRKHFNEFVMQQILRGQKPVVKFEAPESARSPAQNSALQLWCEMCAQTFRDAGIDLRHAIREEVEIPVTKESFREYIWRPLQKVMTGHESTTKPSTKEYPEISETIHRHFAETLNVELPDWPSRFGPGEGG